MTYPTELIEIAKYEMHVFDRVSAETGAALIVEVERLRLLVNNPSQESTSPATPSP